MKCTTYAHACPATSDCRQCDNETVVKTIKHSGIMESCAASLNLSLLVSSGTWFFLSFVFYSFFILPGEEILDCDT